MPKCVEEPAHREITFFASDDIFDAEVVEEVAVALALGCDRVPEYRLREYLRCV